jgi:hypothetical protein
MFRALLIHPQKALHKRHSIYCVCVISVGCTNPGSAKLQHARNIQSAVGVTPPEDEQVIFQICRGP